MATAREDAESRFPTDIAKHQMKVIKDDGIYRHLRFAVPGTNCCSFDMHADPLRIITHDGDGYHVTALGDEVATVDQTTGEVCRKRPAVSRITVPAMRPDILAAILAHSLTKSAGPAKNVEMAGTLVNRARAHLDELAKRADKLAAKGQVEQ